MKMTFQPADKEFDDALEIGINGKVKTLTAQRSRIEFDLSNTEELTVQARYVRTDLPKVKNPIGKFFVWLLVLLISPLVFFADNDNGIGIHKFFFDAKPFAITKTLRIHPTEQTLSVRYIAPKYNRQAKQFTAPDIVVEGAEVMAENTCVTYDRATLKTVFRAYHYPAYTILFALLLALGAMMGLTLRNQFDPFHLAGVIGMSLCCAVMLALLIAFVCLFIATHKLFRQIDRTLMRDYAEKGE